MHPIFRISSQQIKIADDATARELVARLCHAELHENELPESAVTWGGDQRAKDGGVDVRVDVAQPLSSPNFIPHQSTALQVKAEKFAPKQIAEEMAPRGMLRPAIRDLGVSGGAYIIASTRDDCSDAAIKLRRTAMQKRLELDGLAEKVSCDFYDSRRIADWIERHPTVATWFRFAIGQPLLGWRPYGAWAYQEESVGSEYIVDDRVRVFVPGAEEGTEISHAIEQIRKDLSKPGAVRIVGLSGVGKTRLAQALFDSRVCDMGNILSPENVIYCDLGNEIQPIPSVMIEGLFDNHSDAIVVVDNCGQETHSRLAEIANRSTSKLKLLTIEYDIRDDLPEGTSCYRLESASQKVIIELLKRRFSILSDTDVDRIAEFSDGNARVAFALAATAKGKGDFSTLRNADLFKRLFQQKHSENETLLRCAEAASLLYSFDAVDVSDNSELALLAAFAEVSSATFQRSMAELKRRGLLQERGPWRAVLPPAIANGLAKRAMESLSTDLLRGNLIDNVNERTARSFTRRLGYLHDFGPARELAAALLSASGKLGDLRVLSDFEGQMFANLAPLDEQAALEALERASIDPSFNSSDENRRLDRYARVARSIAYSPDLFDRAVVMLQRFALAEQEKHNQAPMRELMQSLFYSHLSGTHATVTQRIAVASRLFEEEDETKIDLGFRLLKAGLEAWHFTSHFGFEFGARPRDYGWYPKTWPEHEQWYLAWIDIAVTLGLRADKIGKRARVELAEAFRGLWTSAGIFDKLEATALRLKSVDGWPEGWLAAKRTLHYDKKGFEPKIIQRLCRLRDTLHPDDLLAEIRAKVLSRGSFSFGLDDDEDDVDDVNPQALGDRLRRAEEEAEALGEAVASDESLLDVLLPELVDHKGGSGSHPFSFGRGIGRTNQSVDSLLDKVRTAIEGARVDLANLLFVRGVLRGWWETSPEQFEAFMETAIADPVWVRRFIELQVQSPLDDAAFRRLMAVLESRECPIYQFKYLGFGRVTDTLSVNQICQIAVHLAEISSDGFSVAFDLLSMTVHCTDNKDEAYKSELAIGLADLLSIIDWGLFNQDYSSDDYHIETVLKYTLSAGPDQNTVREIVERIVFQAKEMNRYLSYRTRHLIAPLIEYYPIEALDIVYMPDEDGSYRTAYWILSDSISDIKPTAMAKVPTGKLIEWCSRSPDDRFLFAASICELFKKHGEDKILSISETAIAVLVYSPNKKAILAEYIDRFRPSSWSGSRADILESRMPLLKQFESYVDAGIQAAIAEAEQHLKQQVLEIRKSEAKSERARDATFE